MKQYLDHLMDCSNMSPYSTRAFIIVPKCLQEPWYRILKSCTLLHEYSSGSELLTYLNSNGTFYSAGLVHWLVQVLLLDEDCPRLGIISNQVDRSNSRTKLEATAASDFPCHKMIEVLTEQYAKMFQFP